MDQCLLGVSVLLVDSSGWLVDLGFVSRCSVLVVFVDVVVVCVVAARIGLVLFVVVVVALPVVAYSIVLVGIVVLLEFVLLAALLD